jgi:hypothetical protein
VAEGRPEAYRRENIYYFGNDEPAYRAGLLNMLATYQPATYVIAGAITGTGDQISTWASKSMDVFIIGGQARNTHQSITLAFDYAMYMSDVYAAGAMLSNDEVMKSTLISSDIMTWVTLIMVVGAVILGIAGMPIVAWLAT